MWPVISEHQPDLFIWLGDIVYADTDDSVKMQNIYAQQKSKPNYAQFILRTPVIGIWDDHDYGKNDGGKEWHFKDKSKEHLLRFLDVPVDAPVRSRKGAYQSYTFGSEPRKVKILLLDTRYFRDPIDNKKRSGDILGEEQWRWLEQELESPDVALFIIGSGIQVLPIDHRFEKWQNFSQSRHRLLKLLPPNSIILSGDRHIGEISQVENEVGHTLTEVTSSGLTHAYTKLREEKNRFRLGHFVNQNHFGVVQINWDKSDVSMQLRGQKNQIYEEITVINPFTKNDAD